MFEYRLKTCMNMSFFLAAEAVESTHMFCC